MDHRSPVLGQLEIERHLRDLVPVFFSQTAKQGVVAVAQTRPTAPGTLRGSRVQQTLLMIAPHGQCTNLSGKLQHPGSVGPPGH